MKDTALIRSAAGPRRSAAALLGMALLSLISAAGAIAAGAGSTATLDRRPVCIRERCFDAEIAVTAAERNRGLMYRDALAMDRGMLFIFPEEGFHRFWMKNTRIELDIIFIGSDRRVVSISSRAKPCRREPCDLYSPEGNAAYVLEIAGGLAAAYGFAPGDPVEFRQPLPSR